MLISELGNQIKDKSLKIFQKGRVFLIQQNLNQHSDFLTVSWMINQLENEKSVAFISFRQNYAHFLSLSKKVGKSIQSFLKSKKLSYYECFQSNFCTSQLPLTQSSPNSYISPPTSIKKFKSQDMMKFDIAEQNQTIIIDAISFVQDISIIYKICQQALQKNCKIILGGAMEGSQIVEIFKLFADLYIKLQNDVGNHGRIKLITQNSQTSLLWKYIQGKFQVTQYIKL